jgi:MoaA/NifB/PqqE/SkfB family radical SAM enzyme
MIESLIPASELPTRRVGPLSYFRAVLLGLLRLRERGLRLLRTFHAIFTKSDYQRLFQRCLTHPKIIPSILRATFGVKRYSKKYFDQKSETSGPPITVIIRTTNLCNQRCTMCGQWGDNGYLKKLPAKEVAKQLSTEQILNLIDQVAPNRPYISFFGGEPLMRKDIGELVARATSHNLLTTMNSNCTLLKQRADELVKAGLSFYRASLDGPQGVNEKIRVSNDSYTEAVDGLKYLMEVRKREKSAFPIIQMCTTITLQNQYHLVETAELADELGVDTFALLFGIFMTEPLIAKSNKISREALDFEWNSWKGFVDDRTGMDVQAIQKQLDEIKSRKWKFRFRTYPPMDTAFDVDNHYNHPEKTHGGGLCVLPWVRMEVLPNGDVGLCEDTPDYLAGNVQTQHPLEIWNGLKYKRFRKYLLDQGIFPSCTRCSALYEVPHYLNEFLPPIAFDV